MHVEVRLHATLAGYLPPRSHDGVAIVDLDEGATVAHLVERLAIPADVSRVVLLDGHDVPDDTPLRDGDAVDIFPPLAGGCRGPVVHSGGSGSV